MIYKGVELPELKPASERRLKGRKKKALDPETAAKIVRMYNDDATYAEISKECEINKTALYYFLKNLRSGKEG